MQFDWIKLLLTDVVLVMLGLWAWITWDAWRSNRKYSPDRRLRRRRGCWRNYDRIA